jgi:alpha-glucosidase
MTFTLGHALLIAPPPKMESPQAYDVCLPSGGWYDYWTGRAVARTMTAARAGDGATHISETPHLERLPVFVRAGTILPRQPVVQSTSERPVGPLYLDVFPGGDCSGTLYLDDGHSMGFEKGDFLRQVVRCTVDDRGNVAITFDPRQGGYRPWWKQIEVVVHGRSGQDRVSSSTVPVRSGRASTAGSVDFYLSDIPNGGTIKINRAYR